MYGSVYGLVHRWVHGSTSATRYAIYELAILFTVFVSVDGLGLLGAPQRQNIAGRSTRVVLHVLGLDLPLVEEAVLVAQLLALASHFLVNDADLFVVGDTGLGCCDGLLTEQEVEHTAVGPEEALSVDDPVSGLAAGLFEHKEEHRVIGSAVEALAGPNPGGVLSSDGRERESDHRGG